MCARRQHAEIGGGGGGGGKKSREGKDMEESNVVCKKFPKIMSF